MRLDQMLVNRGLAASRARARDLILRGFVRVGSEACNRPAREVSDDAPIAVDGSAPVFVSRGAEKLVAALDHFGFAAAGRTALDVGASTGGFTQVLLQRGAERIYAVDVGTSQLHADIKADPRVISLEQQDARGLSRDLIPDDISALVADVSFISLTKVLPAALRLTAPSAWMIALIKPQFEAGPGAVGKGGIVRDAAARKAAVDTVSAFIRAQPGWTVDGTIVSPILGGSGNEEFLIGARRNG
jgi:23S rRNA (cytidine1920-2'-O)/16S rRNA (cytidine1409-2'-O)-methyltransferase